MSQPLVKKAGIKKARERLGKAKAAYSKCLSSATHEQYAKWWGEFLIASGAIIHVIEGASRHTPQGRQWYGGKRKQDRKDPLLLYLYQARNEEEHGIEPVTKQEQGGLILRSPPSGVTLRAQKPGSVTNDNFANILLDPDNWIGSMPEIEIFLPKPGLLPVTSKEGDVFHPPKEHLGKQLKSGTPDEVAKLYLSYLDRLVEEAERLS